MPVPGWNVRDYREWKRERGKIKLSNWFESWLGIDAPRMRWDAECVCMLISLPRMSHEILDHLLARKFSIRLGLDFFLPRVYSADERRMARAAPIVQKRRSQKATFIAVVKNDLTSSSTPPATRELSGSETYSKHLTHHIESLSTIERIKSKSKCLKSFALLLHHSGAELCAWFRTLKVELMPFARCVLKGTQKSHIWLIF